MRIEFVVQEIGAKAQPTMVGPFRAILQAEMWAHEHMKDEDGNRIDFQVLPLVRHPEPWRPFSHLRALWGEAAS